MSKLKELRERKNITQAELARQLGLSVDSISRWECGRHMPRLYLSQAKELLRILDCTLEEIDQSGL
jgi:transcriptional regulator with XRE-family HTH domain